MDTGCTCQDCGKQYRIDLMLSDSLWAVISPSTSGNPKGGLLCGACIMTRLEALVDQRTVFGTLDTSGALTHALLGTKVDHTPSPRFSAEYVVFHALSHRSEISFRQLNRCVEEIGVEFPRAFIDVDHEGLSWIANQFRPKSVAGELQIAVILHDRSIALAQGFDITSAQDWATCGYDWQYPLGVNERVDQAISRALSKEMD